MVSKKREDTSLSLLFDFASFVIMKFQENKRGTGNEWNTSAIGLSC
jgi:hypothetical protein